MIGSNVLVPLYTSTAGVVVPPGSPPPALVGDGNRGAAQPLQLDAARPVSASPKDGDQTATTGRGPAAIVKISKTAARAGANANQLAPRLPNEMSNEERQVIAELKSTDREVRAHEQAHAIAGGQHAGAPSYEYQRGPDGRQYAVGGEVPMSITN